MNKVIYIDAGHGGTDAGAANGKRRESDDNLRLSLAVHDLLCKQGHTVVLTRVDDRFVSLAERTQIANAAGASIFVSLHRNSHTNATAKGVEVWVYTTAGAVEVGAATEVLEQLITVGVQANRGIKQGNYHVLRESNMPAMLVELGFISNAEDNRLFDAKFDAYAEAIARGICAALGVAWKDAAPQTKPLYRVQVGAFSVKSNAEAFLQTVKNMGLQAFLVEPEQAREE